MGYAAPAEVWVSCDWQCHRNRPDGGSPEPGTDYATEWGSDLAMAGNGTVSVVDHSTAGGEGRRLSVDLDDGRRVSYIHLASIQGWVGQRVARGQTGVCRSGASGNGQDWYYGPHVHVSLWQRPGMSYRDTIDFEFYVGPEPPPPPPPPPPKEPDMLIFQAKTGDGGGINGVCYALAPGTLYVCRDADEARNLAAANNPSGELITIWDYQLSAEFDARGIPRDLTTSPGGFNWAWSKDSVTGQPTRAVAAYTLAGIGVLNLIGIIALITEIYR